MFIASSKAQETLAVPTADDVALFLQDLMEFVPYGESLSSLFSRESQRVRRVTTYGIRHGYFNYDGDCYYNGKREKAPALSFIFHDSGPITMDSPNEKLYERLLLLDDASWLLSRKRVGSRTWRNKTLLPSTVHCHTAELLPILKELGIVGQPAVRRLHAFLCWLNPSLEVAKNWNDLRTAFQQIYPIAA